MIFNELPVNGHVCDEVLKVNGLQTDFLHDLIGPFICDIMQYVKPGASAEIRVETVSTWYNALVHDASLPEAERTTWTKNGPKADASYHDAGLLGPAKFFFKTNDRKTNDKDKKEK